LAALVEHALLDHLVGPQQQRVRNCEPERLGGLEIDHKLEARRLKHRQIPRPNAVEYQLLLTQSDDKSCQVEACFRQAIDIASRQRAKSFELRATTSLSRVLQKQGKREDARRILAGTYVWFTEGFDTRDLKDARTLLDELTTH
jgi:hypothetical protein